MLKFKLYYDNLKNIIYISTKQNSINSNTISHFQYPQFGKSAQNLYNIYKVRK